MPFNNVDHESSFDRLHEKDCAFLLTNYRQIQTDVDNINGEVNDVIKCFDEANEIRDNLMQWSKQGLDYIHTDPEVSVIYTEKVNNSNCYCFF